MSAQNQGSNWVRAQGSANTQRGNITPNQAVLHSITIGFSNGTYRIGNGTLGSSSLTFAGSSFKPTAFTQQEFKELEFSNGISIETEGTVSWQAIFNDLV